MNNYDYPEGADNSSAPWNEEDKKSKEIEVCISVTLSKTVKIKVSDYTIIESGVNEDGEPFEDIDYSTCDLKSAVEEQVYLPQDIEYVLRSFDAADTEAMAEKYEGWNADDFEVYLDN